MLIFQLVDFQCVILFRHNAQTISHLTIYYRHPAQKGACYDADEER